MNQQPKILIVDDSEVVREWVAMMLEDQGFQVVTLESPLGFNRILREEKPDVALVDVNMPALSGDRAVEIANRSGTDCIILLYSDRPESELSKLSHASGAAGFIRKTGDGKQLVDALKKILESR